MNNRLEEILKRTPIIEDEYWDIYESLTLLPPGFNPKDPEKIKLFAERLKSTRQSISKQNPSTKHQTGLEIEGPRSCNVTTQEQVAKWLGLTPARVSQIENGKIEQIPVEYLVSFYDMFNVTPHYLLGYTHSPQETLLVRSGKILTDDNGEYKVGILPMTYPLLSQKKAITILSVLASRNIDWFLTLGCFLRADDKTLETGFNILNALMGYPQLEKENDNVG